MFNINEISVEAMIVLPCGRCVERRLYCQLQQHIEAAVPRLCPGASYKIQDLVPKEFWQPLPRGTRCDLGRCLAYWVCGGLLGLEFVGCPRCNRKLYRPKD